MFCLSGIHINVDFELFAFLSFFLVVLSMLVLLLFPVPPLVATWTFTLTFLFFVLFLSITLTVIFLCLLPSSLSLLFFLFFFIIIIFWVVFNVWVFLLTLFLIWWWSSSVLLILHALLLLSELVPLITYWLSRGALLASLLLLIVNSFWAWVRFYFLSAFSFWFYILVWLLLLFVFIRDVLLSTKFRRFFFVRRCLLSLFSGCFISLLRSDLLSFLLFPSSHLFTISVLSWVLIGGDSRFHFLLLLISWRGVWLLSFFEIWIGVFICTS